MKKILLALAVLALGSTVSRADADIRDVINSSDTVIMVSVSSVTATPLLSTPRWH